MSTQNVQFVLNKKCDFEIADLQNKQNISYIFILQFLFCNLGVPRTRQRPGWVGTKVFAAIVGQVIW